MGQLMWCAQRVHLELLTNNMSEIDQAVERCLPQVWRKLLEHGSDRELKDLRGHHVGRITCERLETIVHKSGCMLFEKSEETWGLHDGHLRHLCDAGCDSSFIFSLQEGRVQQSGHRRHVRAE